MFRKISNMSMFAGLDVPENNGVIDPEFVPSDSELDNILREIFSVDEFTGLPKGDLAYYLSPDGNPQVKSWLESNLLKPKAVSNGSSVEGVTDDMIAEMQRVNGESMHDYQVRLKNIYDDCAKQIAVIKSKSVENE